MVCKGIGQVLTVIISYLFPLQAVLCLKHACQTWMVTVQHIVRHLVSGQQKWSVLEEATGMVDSDTSKFFEISLSLALLSRLPSS